MPNQNNNGHVVLPGSKRAANPNAKRVGDVDPNEKITVTVNLAGPKLPGADDYVGQTISPTEFAEKFGASRADADKVAKSLRKYGLKVEDLSLSLRSMKVSGTAAAMEAAFKPNMVMLRSTRSSQREFRGR